MVLDAAGNVWFVESTANKIGKLDPSTGHITEYALPPQTSCPEQLAFGPNGNIWFAEDCVARIGQLNPVTGVSSDFPLPAPLQRTIFVTEGQDGAMWFSGDGPIVRVSMSEQVTIFRPPHAAYAIATGPFGRLWFTELYDDAVGNMNVHGFVREYPVPTPNSTPLYIATAPNRHLYFTELSTNKIGRVTLRGVVTEITVPPLPSGTHLYGICADSLSNVWFTETSLGTSNPENIGVATPAGNVVLLSLPLQTGPLGCAAGADHKVYFAAEFGNAIGLVEY